MGKRELLLVLGFVVAGTVMYQLTARPAAEGERRFSLSALIDHVRREVRGHRGSAETTATTAYPVADATSEVRVTFDRGSAESLEISGEDREDVEAELHVSSNGIDTDEARRLAAATVLKGDEAGGRLNFTLTYPKEGRQRANVTLRVPSRMRVSVARYSGTLSIHETGDVELVDSRGEAKIRGVTGRVTASHRGGEIDVADVTALKLTARGSDVRIARISGDVTIQSQAGEIRGTELEGAVTIDSTNTEVRLERLETMGAAIHVTASGGSVELRGVSSETRVDAKNAAVTVSIAEPVPVTIFAEGGDEMEVSVPPGGFQLDAVATAGGSISVPDDLIEVVEDQEEQRASGPVNGGGPTLTLRAAHGEIVLRAEGSSFKPRASERPTPPRPPPPPPRPPDLKRW
jgi:hypothetical protein